jgi:hypothetical protein
MMSTGTLTRGRSIRKRSTSAEGKALVLESALMPILSRKLRTIKTHTPNRQFSPSLGKSRTEFECSKRTALPARRESTMGFIYQLVFPNGKMYIGQTKNVKRRWQLYRVRDKAREKYRVQHGYYEPDRQQATL